MIKVKWLKGNRPILNDDTILFRTALLPEAKSLKSRQRNEYVTFRCGEYNGKPVVFMFSKRLDFSRS